MIHIRCGSDIVAKLAAGGVAGRVVVWPDPLCEGPVVGQDRASIRAIRGPWLAARFSSDPKDVVAQLTADDASLEAARDAAEEVVLWFESDLFDQAILVHLLDLLAPRLEQGRQLSLVTLHEHPSRVGFVALGHLNPSQLAQLLPERITITPEMVARARLATAAWSAPTPQRLDGLRREADGALPYLNAAIERMLEELPARRSGIGRTERQALEAVAAGNNTAGAAFVASQAREERPWMGDSMFWAHLAEMSEGAEPLLKIDGEWPPEREGARTRLSLTSLGEAVVAGQHIWTGRARPLWIGGTQVPAGPSGWRWDADRREVVRVA